MATGQLRTNCGAKRLGTRWKESTSVEQEKLKKEEKKQTDGEKQGGGVGGAGGAGAEKDCQQHGSE